MLWLLFCVFSQNDPIAAQDSRPLFFNPFNQTVDSLKNPVKVIDPVFQPRLPFFQKADVSQRPEKPAHFESKEEYFYYLMFILFFIGFIIKSYPKYFSDMSRVLFRAGFRQKSIRDQLSQNKQASLILNFIFFLVGGTFLYLIAVTKGVEIAGEWYSLLAICIVFITTVYTFKFIGLYLAKWLFGYRDSMEAYIFIVFFLNKVAGLALIPFIIFLWIGHPSLYPYLITLSFIMLVLFYVYRYRLIFPILNSNTRISGWHFFIYLCSFEILPLLIVSKILLSYINA